MTQQDYEQKKRECWEEFKREEQCLPASRHDVFCAAFDRAYTLCKQEKDADKEEMFTCEKSKVLYRFRMAEACKIGNNPEADYWIGYSKAIQDLFGLEGEPYVTSNDAENTPISERLTPEEKSQLEGIYYYLKRAADKQENESVSVAVLFEVMERLEDIFGIDLLTNGHGKLASKDADTVIQGWVCRDEDNTLTLFYGSNKPSKEDGDDYWSAVYGNALEYLNQNLFPDVKWEDAEPTKVEITIKRKKNGH